LAAGVVTRRLARAVVLSIVRSQTQQTTRPPFTCGVLDARRDEGVGPRAASHVEGNLAWGAPKAGYWCQTVTTAFQPEQAFTPSDAYGMSAGVQTGVQRPPAP